MHATIAMMMTVMMMMVVVMMMMVVMTMVVMMMTIQASQHHTAQRFMAVGTGALRGCCLLNILNHNALHFVQIALDLAGGSV